MDSLPSPSQDCRLALLREKGGCAHHLGHFWDGVAELTAQLPLTPVPEVSFWHLGEHQQKDRAEAVSSRSLGANWTVLAKWHKYMYNASGRKEDAVPTVCSDILSNMNTRP